MTPTYTFITEDTVKQYHDDYAKKQLETVLGVEERRIFESVFFVAVCGVVCVLGINANILNIIIFYKQGFTNTVNIAFLGLAISDLSCLITLEWMSICMNPLLQVFGVPWVGVEVMYISAALPHICFCRITSYITVYITAERLMSIALPLKVKQIVTTSRVTLIICLIYFANLLTLVPEFATSYLGWRFVPERNMTLLAVIFTKDRKSMEGISFVIHSTTSTVSFVGVIIFTILLVIQLKRSSKRRQEITAGQNQTGSISARDNKTVKMIVLIASILIFCYTPGAMISMTTFVLGSEFNIQGKYVDICTILWSIACSFQSINSSINIFIYYRMSSKYKQTFDYFLKRPRRDEKYRQETSLHIKK